STVALADRVALLQDGVITHIDTHTKLLNTVPAYRALLSAAAEHDAQRQADQEAAWDTKSEIEREIQRDAVRHSELPSDAFEVRDRINVTGPKSDSGRRKPSRFD